LPAHRPDPGVRTADRLSVVSRALLVALATRGPLENDALVAATGETGPEVRSGLEALLRQGLVAEHAATPTRLGLSTRGRTAAENAIVEERALLGPVLEAVYREFAPLNQALKRALTAWQQEPSPPQARELLRVEQAARPMLDRLAALRPRYARLRTALREAGAGIAAGDTRFVAGLGVESLHSLWWQLHADLLAVLGRSRGEDDA